MTDVGNAYHRYVTELEEQNERFRAMIQSRDIAFNSVNAENENLRQRLDRACRIADETSRELDLYRGLWRTIGAAATEAQQAIKGPVSAPQKPIVSRLDLHEVQAAGGR